MEEPNWHSLCLFTFLWKKQVALRNTSKSYKELSLANKKGMGALEVISNYKSIIFSNRAFSFLATVPS